MSTDYRNTEYCPELSKLTDKKCAVKNAVLKVHSKARDMHTYISDKDEPFKRQFAEAYNWKCAYCGVSIKIIPMGMFEVDHFIPKKAARFNNSKANAGCIENLVLSCSDCNRLKGDFECLDEDLDKINPDGTQILNTFVRDDEYYIRINDKLKGDKVVSEFYERVRLGNELHRIDYLLMNMCGLCDKIMDNASAYRTLKDIIEVLQTKRNIIG